MFYLITPLKDEINNIDRLIASIENQSMHIDFWLIIENDSTDGSKEYLKKFNSLKNVGDFKVVNLEFEDKEYSIGEKYSTIVNYGFNYIKSNKDLNENDYIGLLDSDSFPQNNYFEVLIKDLNEDPSIGLIGGVLTYDDGSRDNANDVNVRGSGRVWNFKCFIHMGEYYGLSPDAISLRKAILGGFNPVVNQNAYFISREANSRVSYSFKGKSIYYNGYTITFALLKGLTFFIRRPVWGIEYFKGYIWSYKNSIGRNPDKEIIKYNKGHLLRVIKRKLSL